MSLGLSLQLLMQPLEPIWEQRDNTLGLTKPKNNYTFFVVSNRLVLTNQRRF